VTENVSRETPPAPPAAQGVFGLTLPTAERLAEWLAGAGVVRGLLGPREAPRLWERHLINCALLGSALDHGIEVCDVGSGAGLPGLVVAVTRPDLAMTLVEPLARRTDFLTEVARDLGLDNVEVVRARADDLHGRRDFDVVTSRAVAPLPRLLAWSMPLVRQGGAMLAMKGSSVHEEIAGASEELRRQGAGEVTVLRLGSAVIDPATTVVRVEATRPSRLGWESTPGREMPRTRRK
jgi:16S rRNA (guanine527-N7)-methyltransferase